MNIVRVKALEPYKEFNIQKRKEAKARSHIFGDVLFKLMNSAFCGNAIENVYNWEDIDILNDFERHVNLIRNIYSNYAIDLDEYLSAVDKVRGKVNFG